MTELRRRIADTAKAIAIYLITLIILVTLTLVGNMLIIPLFCYNGISVCIFAMLLVICVVVKLVGNDHA